MSSIRYMLFVFFLVSSFGAQAGEQTKCSSLVKELDKAHVKLLVVKDLTEKGSGFKADLVYKGLFLKTNAKHEGRRVISHLMRCYKIEYETTTGLFSYSVSIKGSYL